MVNVEIRKKLVFSAKKCIGCRLCELACITDHEHIMKLGKSRIRIIRDHEKQIDKAIYCHFCSETPCITACPQSAISINQEKSALAVDREKCDGCGNCIEACPFDSPILDTETSKILICDLCGGAPSCVEICPEAAIIFK